MGNSVAGGGLGVGGGGRTMRGVDSANIENSRLEPNSYP